ncbi:hypothetical protein [Paenibacillus eucommiae]|uniref:Uncharacterized protein n=1 Tax=Paenibacillus eucommiae TaxID=1355755 RepID=A0ABS4ITE2_9BACL|nr:hypothetical protein [Paenibacillus eucommiae]MBP1990830.1 hypothetical protein [Paenibacillus eucommiae]
MQVNSFVLVLPEVSKTTGQEVSTNYNPATGALSDSFAPGEGRLYALDASFESNNSEAIRI